MPDAGAALAKGRKGTGPLDIVGLGQKYGWDPPFDLNHVSGGEGGPWRGWGGYGKETREVSGAWKMVIGVSASQTFAEQALGRP